MSDDADPVQQVVQPPDERYVGVIDHTEHDWFYAFDRYDDVDGRQRRAVCGHCVQEEREAAEVTHFTRAPEEYDVDRARAALALHYQVDHEGRALPEVLAEELDVDPAALAERHGLAGPTALSLRDVTRRLDEMDAVDAADRLGVPDVDVEPGASLVSGTTIASNTAWHAGNDGTGSGLDADTLDGFDASLLLDTTTVTTTTRTTVTSDEYGATATISTPLPKTAKFGKLYYYQTGAELTFSQFTIPDKNVSYFSQGTVVRTSIPTSAEIQIKFYR